MRLIETENCFSECLLLKRFSLSGTFCSVAPQAPVVGVYAQGGGKVWSGGYQYCIHSTNCFNYGSEANSSPSVCRSQGGKLVSFVNVGSIKSSQTSTFNN